MYIIIIIVVVFVWEMHTHMMPYESKNDSLILEIMKISMLSCLRRLYIGEWAHNINTQKDSNNARDNFTSKENWYSLLPELNIEYRAGEWAMHTHEASKHHEAFEWIFYNHHSIITNHIIIIIIELVNIERIILAWVEKWRRLLGVSFYLMFSLMKSTLNFLQKKINLNIFKNPSEFNKSRMTTIWSGIKYIHKWANGSEKSRQIKA